MSHQFASAGNGAAVVGVRSCLFIDRAYPMTFTVAHSVHRRMTRSSCLVYSKWKLSCNARGRKLTRPCAERLSRKGGKTLSIHAPAVADARAYIHACRVDEVTSQLIAEARTSESLKKVRTWQLLRASWRRNNRGVQRYRSWRSTRRCLEADLRQELEMLRAELRSANTQAESYQTQCSEANARVDALNLKLHAQAFQGTEHWTWGHGP